MKKNINPFVIEPECSKELSKQIKERGFDIEYIQIFDHGKAAFRICSKRITHASINQWLYNYHKYWVSVRPSGIPQNWIADIYLNDKCIYSLQGSFKTHNIAMEEAISNIINVIL